MASRSFHSSSSTPKIERKIIEKNRRNHMKTLSSKLHSLLPNHGSKETVPLPDRIDGAVEYIKSLEMKLEKLKEKKETLLSSSSSSGRKRTHTASCKSTESDDPSIMAGMKSPQIEIREMGPALEVVLINRKDDDKFVFHEIIRIIHEEGAEVVSANSSVVGNSVFCTVHAQTGKFAANLEAARVSNKLKEFVNGSTSSVESLPAEAREFGIQPDIWELESIWLLSGL